jgi:hypothetical protein
MSEARFDPVDLVEVETAEQIKCVAPGSSGLFVRRLDDSKLAVIAAQRPAI